MCLREAFDLFDTDGSGTIDAKELKVAMRCAHNMLAQMLMLTMRECRACMLCRLVAMSLIEILLPSAHRMHCSGLLSTCTLVWVRPMALRPHPTKLPAAVSRSKY